MDLPDFKNGDDEILYYEIFEENLTAYKFMLDKVKEELYGKGTGNYSNLPGSCFEVVNDITRSLMYQTSTQFKYSKPEYKDQLDEVFIPHRDLKTAIKEALQEVNDNLSN
jgi:hypothetical protein